MELKDKITQLIFDAIADVNAMRQPDQALAQAPGTILVGETSDLDSLGFVALVASLETKFERGFGKQFSLIDIMLARENVQWTVAALAEQVERMLRNGASGTASTPATACA